MPQLGSLVLPEGVVILTDDGRGIANACADRLADLGQQVVVVQHAAGANGEDFRADLTDIDAVSKLIADIRAQMGPIGGIIHLLPFASIDGDSAERASLEVKSIYLLTKVVEAEVAFVLSATTLGGQLGFGAESLESLARAGSGGISGYLKCLGMEWPDVLVRTIDYAPTTDSSEVIECIERELADPAGPYEVGYRDGQRVTWQVDTAVLGASGEQTVQLDRDSVILITGGARGITAAIAEQIGERYQSTLILMGRSPLPSEVEDESTIDCVEPAELKRAIIEDLKSRGEQPAPAVVEKAFNKIMTEREVRANIESIRATGSVVEYYSVDVSNREALAAACESIYASHGKLDGVIHGAGVIDDKLVKDKTPESFDRVFKTKVDSTYALIDALRPESLQFVSLFASIASRYGNRGQSDYAAANDVLCKLATELDRQWAARTFAVAWGPWGSIGMVSDLEKHLSARGIALISPEVGCRMFVDEVVHGPKGASEVIIAGGADNLVTPSTNQAAAHSVA